MSEFPDFYTRDHFDFFEFERSSPIEPQSEVPDYAAAYEGQNVPPELLTRLTRLASEVIVAQAAAAEARAEARVANTRHMVSYTLLVTSDRLHVIEESRRRDAEARSEVDERVGLLHRPVFLRRVESHIAGNRRETDRSTTNWLIFLDLDKFHELNEIYGHIVGDRVLLAVSDAFRNSVRQEEEDETCRWGGEELAGFVSHASLEDILEIAERCRMNIETLDLPGLARNYTKHPMTEEELAQRRITVSIGVAPLPQQGDIQEAAINADAALYLVKHQGRNGVALHNPELGEAELITRPELGTNRQN